MNTAGSERIGWQPTLEKWNDDENYDINELD